MNTRSTRLTLLAAAALATPALTFAGGQPAKVYTPGRQATQDSTLARAVQTGKSTGNLRSQAVIRASAYRAQPATGRVQPATLSDTAFRK